VKERGNLSMLPELGLKTALPYVENVDEFGHRVHVALLRVSLILTHCFMVCVCDCVIRQNSVIKVSSELLLAF